MSKIMTDREAYLEYFKDGTCFWTSEDGDQTDLVIIREIPEQLDDQHTAKVKLFSEYGYIKRVDWTQRLQPAFVQYGPMPDGWHDGG